MSIKRYLIILVSMLVMFAFGCADVMRTVGKIGVECLAGYALCLVSVMVVVCTTMVVLVTRKENKKNERML